MVIQLHIFNTKLNWRQYIKDKLLECISSKSTDRYKGKGNSRQCPLCWHRLFLSNTRYQDHGFWLGCLHQLGVRVWVSIKSLWSSLYTWGSGDQMVDQNRGTVQISKIPSVQLNHEMQLLQIETPRLYLGIETFKWNNWPTHSEKYNLLIQDLLILTVVDDIYYFLLFNFVFKKGYHTSVIENNWPSVLTYYSVMSGIMPYYVLFSRVPWLIITSQWLTTLLGMPHCGTTMGNDIARDIHCDATMNNDVAMCT